MDDDRADNQNDPGDEHAVDESPATAPAPPALSSASLDEFLSVAESQQAGDLDDIVIDDPGDEALVAAIDADDADADDEALPDAFASVESVSARTSRGRSLRHVVSAALVRLVGHVVFSLAGLVAGYYILCWLRPRANFLHLDLPGLHVTWREFFARLLER